MPEGDTILKTATTLRRALLGQPIVAVETPSPKALGRWPISRLVGTTVEAIEPRGKFLLIRFSNGLVLNSHMQMTGSWHLYRPGQRWQQPRHLARVVLRSERFEAVCFRAPVVQLLGPTELAAHAGLADLGPDLLSPVFDADQARRRLSGLAESEIAAALLDQRALAGIGNVYKSEALFLERQSPNSRVSDLTAGQLDRLIQRARRLLLANRETRSRNTTGIERPGADLWVYGRAGQPCRRCRARIQAQRQSGRTTYWCPVCQL